MKTFLRSLSPLKLLAAFVLLSVVSYFIEKPLPSLFLGMRLTGYLLFVMAIYRYFNRK